MNKFIQLCFSILFFSAITISRAEDFFDRLDDSLTFSVFDDAVRARLSGLLDIEYYHFTHPTPALIEASGSDLLNPRLTLFFDSQIGPHFYVFVQSRLDRGFDPSSNGAQIRLDEYAIRCTPWDDGSMSLQVGKFASVIGNWGARHQSWDNPFISAPLLYENITALSDIETPTSASDFVSGDLAKSYEYNPIIWGPGYSTGISLAGKLGRFDYAAEIKNSAPMARPTAWDARDGGFSHSTVNARLGYRPNAMWNFGFSASEGEYLLPEAVPSLPRGKHIGDYCERLLGQDISFAWHHWQLWAECYEAHIDVPRGGGAETIGYYIEAKYKFTPQLFGALRWNQQLFGDVPDGTGGRAAWGHDLVRIDTAVGYRFTPNTQVKFEYNLQRQQDGSHEVEHLLAVQFTVRF